MPRLIYSAILASLSIQSSAVADLINVWDLSQGVQVTGFSPVASYSDNPGAYPAPFTVDIRDMFGGEFSTNAAYPGEIGNVRFRDGLPAGTVHFVEWTIPDFTVIESFELEAQGDAPDVGSRRDYSRFKLFAWDDALASWSLLFDYSVPSHPQPNLISSTLPAFSARQFRAEFTQYSSNYYSGPRILELRGFVTASAVPEPSSLISAGLGLACLMGYVARRRFSSAIIET